VRSLRLARIAAKAELLRLRHMLRRQAIRAALAGAAVVFLLASVAGAHVAGVLALAERVTLVDAVLIVAGIDVVIAIVFAALAARDVPGSVERAALRLRRTAVEQAVDTAVLSSLLARLERARSAREVFAIVAAAVVAWLLGARR
jgi:hypothetical protein